MAGFNALWRIVLLIAAAGGLALPVASASQADYRPPAADTSVLLVPDLSNGRVMSFDPFSGDLVDATFIPADPTHLTTPVMALYSPVRSSVLVADEAKDVVQEYNLSGIWRGTFAPNEGPNPSVLDAPHGLAFRPNGNLLVAVGGGPNVGPRVSEFTGAGATVGTFISNAPGGLANPWSVLYRANDILVSDSNADSIKRYGLDGAYLNEFASVSNLPQQIAATSAGNILVANSAAAANEGILEYNASGSLIARYDPTLPGGPGGGNLSNYRGVYALGNGNLLVTTNSGVYEISRASATVISTKIANVSANFITRANITNYVGLDFTKTVGTDPRSCASTDQITVNAGTLVTYCFAVTNTGNTPITNHDVSDQQFGLIVSDLVRNVQPSVTLYFTRTVVVNQTATYSATWSADYRTFTVSDFDSATVIVNGSSAPDVAVGPASLAVTVQSGAETTRQVTIGNTGNAALSWSIAKETPAGSGTAACAPGPFSQIQPTPASGSTSAGQTATVTVRFSGVGQAGTYAGALCIASNDPDEPVVRIPVSVTVERPNERLTFLPLVRR